MSHLKLMQPMTILPLITEQAFSTLKREPLLDYVAYRGEAEDLMNRIPKAAKRLIDPAWLAGREMASLLRLTRARAEYALDLLALSYSAGVALEPLAGFFPSLLDYFEEYALYSEAFNQTPEGRRHPGPHIALRDLDFERANRLLCFAILLGYQRTVPRIMAIIDYENRKRDGMLERLAARYVERPRPIPAECTRHLPYAKTLPIFAAPEETRAERMREYLAHWYAASRDEPYHGSHAGIRFLGYWSWEAAAITVVLGIDDGAYRDAQYYPRDLAGFARTIATNGGEEANGVLAEYRARAGENCPVDGMWESIGVPTERVHYKQNVELRDLGSSYGLTVWRLIRE